MCTIISNASTYVSTYVHSYTGHYNNIRSIVSYIDSSPFSIKSPVIHAAHLKYVAVGYWPFSDQLSPFG